MRTSMFAAVETAPRDPILGLTEGFNADTRPTKVNLGVGVYQDESGRVPLLDAVKQAEAARLQAALPRGYLAIDGIPGYQRAAQSLLFGESSPVVTGGRAVTVQALGGTGALRIGADLLKRLNPDAEVWISNPSWENHRALFEAAGFKVNAYPYYDAACHGIDFTGMLSTLAGLPARSIVVLHACCHNPTGVDLSDAQWQQVAHVVKARELMAFVDIAYQGLGDGIEADAVALRLFAESGIEFFVSSSFSKSFSLYGERVGALSIVTASREEAGRVLSQAKRVVRTSYSSPPTHGAALVGTVLSSPRLRALWEQELASMRDRIREMRAGLVGKLKERGVAHDFSFMTRQRGMFSYSGLNSAQVDRLRDEFGIYAVSSGRICLAALNSRNIDHVASAIAAVLSIVERPSRSSALP